MKRALLIAALLTAVFLAFPTTASAQSACTLTYVTESLPGFHVGTPANYQIDVCCGTPPYHFEVVGGAFPDGMHMNQNGKITGVPRAEADTVVYVQLSDAAGCTLTQAFSLYVFP